MKDFNPEKYVSDLENLFLSKQNPDKASKMKAYMRNQFDFVGLSSHERMEIFRNFHDKTALPPDNRLPEVVDLLWVLPQREFQYFAMDLIRRRIKYMDEQFIRFLEEMIIHKSWWDTIDFIAASLVSVHFQRYPELIKPIVSRWMDSQNIWLQRSCLLFQLKYKQKTDLKLLYNQIDCLKESKEFFIQKAIGWILREYSKTNPNEVKDYVTNNKLKPLSKREALKIIQKNN